MRPEIARRIVQVFATVALEIILLVALPGWWGVALAWATTITVGIYWHRENRSKVRRRARKRVGPPLEWID